uniref:Phospholipase A2 domain-containing protein n=1 Tax=Panagrolaimus sp. JU765 TaxID=591449 RepID=A0AC34PY30_9BILA
MLAALKAVVFLVLFFTGCANGRGIKVKENGKIGPANLINLRDAMVCGLGTSFSYLGYGCWCGPSDLGYIATKPGTPPVDDVDNCCLKHDLCFNALARKCGWAAGHFIKYKSICVGKNPICSGKHWFSQFKTNF